MAGTEGQHVLRWPWVGSPGPRAADSFQKLVNVESGERRDAADGRLLAYRVQENEQVVVDLAALR